MDRHKPKSDISDQLTAEQAGPLLGHSARHVRRLIARGDLEGTRDPYRTTRAAVDAYRFRQRGKVADMERTQVHERSTSMDHADPILDILRSELSQTRRELAQMAREVGRLEAEVAQLRRQGTGGRPKDGHNGHAAGALARLVPWLRG